MTSSDTQLPVLKNTTLLPTTPSPRQEAMAIKSAGEALPYREDTSVLMQKSRFLRLPEVIARVGIHRSSIYVYMAREDFPKQVTLGPRAVGWLEHEIDAWVARRIETRLFTTRQSNAQRGPGCIKSPGLLETTNIIKS